MIKKCRLGCIINLASIFGKQPGGLLDYDEIKSSVIMITKEFSNYLAKDNILVNAVCPGPIRTPLWEAPGQLGEQLSNVITFLSSDKASYITGQAINIDGGMVKAIG